MTKCAHKVVRKFALETEELMDSFCLTDKANKVYYIIGYVCKTKTMHRLLYFKANFLATLRSHLDVTCSCYFWSSLFNVDVNYIYIYLVNYSCSLFIWYI